MNSRIPGSIILGALSCLLFVGFPIHAVSRLQPRAQPQSQSDSDSRPPLNARDTQIQRAQIQMAEKHYDVAIRTYQDLLQHDPKNAVFLNMIGIANLDLYDYEQAKRYFQRAAKADKKYSSAINNLGMTWYIQKNYRRAIREYKRAEAIDPGQAGTHANLGFAYYNTNKFPEAGLEFQKAIEIDPMIFQHRDRVGTMLQDRTVTNHGLFFFTMARVYATKGDAENCAAYLRKSLDEGYKDLGKAKTDPAFKAVLADPGVQAVLALATPVDPKADPQADTSQPGA